jgi:integrase
MPLTDTVVRSAKPREKQYKLVDGGGLYLLVRPNGAKLWQWDYRRPVTKKRNTIGPGAYPDVPLATARDWRAEQRRLLAAGVDPGELRKAVRRAGEERASNTFEAIAREWLTVRKKDWTARQHDKERDRLENHAFPWIGTVPIAEVGVSHIRPLLSRILDRGHDEQARRLRHQLSRVFRFAIASERAQNNPADALRETLPLRRQKNYPTITDPAKVGELLRAIDAFSGTLPVACALKLMPLVYARPGEIRMAEWSHVNLEGDAPSLTVPPSNRKLRKAEKENPHTPAHVIPLSQQAVQILRELHPMTGRNRFVFPNARHSDRPMSDGALNAALATIGYKNVMVGHGFRHLASTLSHELGWNSDVIERQLSHKTPGVRGVYNKAEHMSERRKMIQTWADYLDGLKAGIKAVSIGRKIA